MEEPVVDLSEAGNWATAWGHGSVEYPVFPCRAHWDTRPYLRHSCLALSHLGRAAPQVPPPGMV